MMNQITQREKIKIMVIDNEPDNTDLLYRLFRREFKVFQAESGSTALKILKQEEEMAVVVADQKMPIMTGTEVLGRIREIFPDTVGVIITGVIDFEDLVEATNSAHVFKFITIPWSPEELKSIIQQSVEIYQTRKQLKAQVSVTQHDLLHENRNPIDTSFEPSDKPRLMVVDDELDNLDLLYRLFQHEFQIFRVNDALAALDILYKEEEMAIIIAGQRMPLMRGTEFLSRARELCPDTVRIILSRFTDVEDLLDGINVAQVFKHIIMPYQPNELKKVIQEAVETYQTNKQIRKQLAE